MTQTTQVTPTIKQLDKSFTRLASGTYAPATLNEADRTVEVVWSTGATVRRQTVYGEIIDEQLSLSNNHVRIDQLNAGAPLLADHDSTTVRSVVGSVVPGSVTVKDNVGRAVVRFSANNPAADVIWRDVKDGHLRSVSVGYKIFKVEIHKQDSGPDLWRAIDWAPFEISVVPVGADSNAKFRSLITEGQHSNMTDNTTTAADTAGAQPKQTTDASVNITIEDRRAADTGAVATKATETGITEADVKSRIAAELANERKRVDAIKGLTRKLKLDDAFADKFIADGSDMHTVHAAAIDAVAERADAVRTRSGVEVPLGGMDERTTMRDGMIGALLHRADSMKFKLEGPAVNYRSYSLIELARRSLEAAGTRTGTFDKAEIAERAFHTTSDFPYILATTANKTLLAAFDAAQKTYEPIVRRVSVPDFNARYEVRMGENPSLDEVNEHGEFKRGTLTESRESYQIKTYGKVIGITRKTIINDDLGAFTRIPAQWGNSVAQKQSDIVWSLITSNAAMADGVTLFHANHGNLGTSGAPSVDTLAAGFVAMAKQKGLDGKTVLNVQPRYLLAPVSLAYGTLAKLFGPIVPEAVANVRPQYMSNLQIIAEPRLDTASAYNWYLAADPSSVGGLIVAYLDGNEAPFFDSRVGFDVDGVELKCRIDFGAAVTEYRGLYKNPATS